MNFGILLIQGLVNSFGLVTMAAFVAAVKIDSFAYMPVQDFGNAFSTYIAQNKGANLEGRIKAGLKVAITISTIFCLIISAIVFIFADKLMLIFIEPSKIEIIRQGAQYLQIEGICYVGIGCLFLLYGYYRGAGKPGISVVLTIISLGTRVVLAYAFAPFFGTLAIWWAIPIGWFLADATGIIFGIKKKNG
ncbi:MATE family efflux transporter [Coprobacillaceae bacterium CR2/5/TPMF4]|nr:MATE family efflux transporter [Coprobacillaceae bacterium CR2/5/TPMF4]